GLRRWSWVFGTILVVEVAVGLCVYGSFDGLASWLTGEVCFVRPRNASIGEVEASARISVPFVVTNLMSEPIEIIGVKRSCACIVPEGIPIHLAGRATCEVSVNVIAAERAKLIREQLALIVASKHGIA